MSENKSFREISQEINEGQEDALKDELLTVEKKEKNIRKIGMKHSIIIVSVAILLIVALIAGYMVFGDNGEKVNTNVKVLYDYEENEIARISIDNVVAGDKMVFTPFMNGTTLEWNIEGQKYDDVYQLHVKRIVQYATHLQSMYILDYSEHALAEYGLEEPSVRAEFTYTDGTVIKVDIGDYYGSSEGAYALVHGINEIYVVTNFARQYLTMPLSEFLTLPSLSKTTVSAQTVSIIDEDRIATTLSYIPGPIYGVDAWYLIEPSSSETSAEAVDALFENLDAFSLTAYYVTEAGTDIEKYGFNKPVFEMQSFDSEGKLLDHLIIGNKAEAENYEDVRYCMILGADDKIEESPVFLVKEEQLSLINANPAELANPYLLALNINWLRGGKIVSDGKEYVITIDRKDRFDDEGNLLYNEDGSQNTANTYYINGIKLDETQFRHFYSTFLFLQIEGVVPADTKKGDSVWSYHLDVVIPVTDNETGVTKQVEMVYSGDYLTVSDSFAVLDSNQSDKAVFTVHISAINKLKTALGLLLEGRMPTK